MPKNLRVNFALTISRLQVAFPIKLLGRRYAAGKVIHREHVSTKSGNDRRGDTSSRGRPSIQRRTRAGCAAGTDQQATAAATTTATGDGELDVDEVCDHHVRFLLFLLVLDDICHGSIRETTDTARRAFPPISHATADPAATRRDRGEAFVIQQHPALRTLNDAFKTTMCSPLPREIIVVYHSKMRNPFQPTQENERSRRNFGKSSDYRDRVSRAFFFALKNSGDMLRDARRDEFYVCSYYALRSPSPRYGPDNAKKDNACDRKIFFR